MGNVQIESLTGQSSIFKNQSKIKSFLSTITQKFGLGDRACVSIPKCARMLTWVGGMSVSVWYVCVCVCVRMGGCVCVCACVRERKRRREKEEDYLSKQHQKILHLIFCSPSKLLRPIIDRQQASYNLCSSLKEEGRKFSGKKRFF